NENTLWKKGSRLGNSTTDPTGMTNRCGSNLLYLWVRRGRGASGILTGGRLLSGLSQTTTFPGCASLLPGPPFTTTTWEERVTSWARADMLHKRRANRQLRWK